MIDSQGCKVEMDFSLLTYINGVKCFNDVIPAILSREAKLRRVQAEADAASDDKTFLKRSNEESLLRFQLNILEQVRIQELIDKQSQSLVSLVDEVQAKLSACLDQVEEKVSKMTRRLEDCEDNSEEVREIAGSFDQLLANTNECLEVAKDTVYRGHECFQQLKKTEDQIDSRSRTKNVVI